MSARNSSSKISAAKEYGSHNSGLDRSCNPLVWHYTTGEYYQRIVRDGFLRPSEPLVPHYVRPILWFSSNPYWERAASRSLLTEDGEIIALTRLETAKLTGGLFRFGASAEAAPLTWPVIRETSGMTESAAQFLYRRGIQMGAKPGEWRGTYERVPAEAWKKIEVFEKSCWIPLLDSSAAVATRTAEGHESGGITQL
jgi:hypothetical protein